VFILKKSKWFISFCNN